MSMRISLALGDDLDGLLLLVLVDKLCAEVGATDSIEIAPMDARAGGSGEGNASVCDVILTATADDGQDPTACTRRLAKVLGSMVVACNRADSDVRSRAGTDAQHVTGPGGCTEQRMHLSVSRRLPGSGPRFLGLKLMTQPEAGPATRWGR